MGLFILSIPILIYETPLEIARWYEAAANEKHLDGELDDALANLAKALQWDPASISILTSQAQWKRESGDLAGSLAACNVIINSHPKLIAAYFLRAETYQLQGRHHEAINDCVKALQLNKERKSPELNQSTCLNALAYNRAVGKIDLDEALDEIQDALKVGPKEADVRDSMGVFYYYYQDYPQARKEMDAAVSLVETEYREFMQRLGKQSKKHQKTKKARRDKQIIELRVASIRVHRAELLRKLGLTKEVEADLRRAKQLSRKVAEIKENMKIPTWPLQVVESRASMIDTRGYIHFRQGSLAKAHEDLDRAVRMSEMCLNVWKGYSPKAKRMAADLRVFEQQSKSYSNHLAVLLYHRALVLEKLGMDAEAQADLQRVRDLGFKPGDDLF